MSGKKNIMKKFSIFIIVVFTLQFDSVFGKFGHKVTTGDDAIFVGDRKIQAFAEPNPKKLPWRDLDVQFVLESTGRFRTREKASQHFEAGAKKVLISAPAQDAVDATIVLGVNDSELRSDHCLISNASCTTNCVSSQHRPEPVIPIKYLLQPGIEEANLADCSGAINNGRTINVTGFQ